MVFEHMKDNATFCYPYDDDRIIFQKLDGKFVGDNENFSRVKELVSTEFLNKYFKLKK